jgi:spore germination cell wall hydrolase CwlJ-like protein
MSESSVRLLRRLAVFMAPVVLAGSGYAVRDLGVIERIPYYLEVTFSGQSSEIAKMANVESGAAGIGMVPAEAARLFREGGRGPRADHYFASRRVVAVGKEPTRSYLAASVTGLDLGGAGPYFHAIDRSRKSDRLVFPQSTLNKTLATANAGPVRPETAPLAVEGAPLAHNAPAPQSRQASMTPGAGVATALFMLPSLARSAQEETSVRYSASTASVNIPARPVPAVAHQAGQSEWPGLYQNARLSGSETATLFGGLTEAQFRAREMRCMAVAIYFEARDEPIKGQIAVAQVIMNRVKSPYYPGTICGVIYQGAEHHNSCQFSFACDGRSDRPTEKKEWATAVDIARRVTYGKVYLKDVGDCTHYHATYVHPPWRRLVRRVTKIGGHIFYKASFAPVQVAEGEL